MDDECRMEVVEGISGRGGMVFELGVASAAVVA